MTDKCVAALTSTGGIDDEAHFDSWITDGIRLNFTSNAGNGYTYKVYLFKGDAASFYAGEFTPSATVDTTVDVTDPGFQLDNLFVVSVDPLNLDIADADARMSIAFVDHTDSVITQCCSATYTDDNDATSDARNYVSTAHAARFISGGQAVEITAILSTGFTAATRLAGVSSLLRLHYLAIKYGDATKHWVGVIDTPTATGNASITAPGFKPQFVMQAPSFVDSVDTTVTTNATGAGSFGIGGFTETVSGGHVYTDQDAAATSNAGSYPTASAARMNQGNATLSHVASFVSFDPTGWTLNYTTTNGTARKWPAWAIEEAAAAAAGTFADANAYDGLLIEPPAVAAY